MEDNYPKYIGISFLIAAAGGLESMINEDVSGTIIEVGGFVSGITLLGKYVYDRFKTYVRNSWKYKQDIYK